MDNMPFMVVLRNRETGKEAYVETHGRPVAFTKRLQADRIADRLRKRLKRRGYRHISVGVKRI